MNTDLEVYGYRTQKFLSKAEAEAEKVVRKLMAHRDEWFYEDVSFEEVIRDAPEVIPEKLLGYKLVRTYEIPSDQSGFKVAGFMDRRSREIVIAGRQPSEVQRFTLAHEIGHVIMHPGESLHRDRPSDGSRTDSSRSSKIEVEADDFAAALLMPPDMVRDAFARCFDGPVVAREADDNLSYLIAGTIGRRVPPSEIRRWKAFELARVIAEMEHFGNGNTMFSSLKSQFAVSTNAMATRLCRIGLVSK